MEAGELTVLAFHLFVARSGHVAALGETGRAWEAGCAHYCFVSRRQHRPRPDFRYVLTPLEPALAEWRAKLADFGILELPGCYRHEGAQRRLAAHVAVLDQLVAGAERPRSSLHFPLRNLDRLEGAAAFLQVAAATLRTAA